jgi:hypothetical protein
LYDDIDAHKGRDKVKKIANKNAIKHEKGNFLDFLKTPSPLPPRQPPPQEFGLNPNDPGFPSNYFASMHDE